MIRLRFAVLCIGLVASSSLALARKHALVLPVEIGGYISTRAHWKREYALALEERLRGAQLSVVNPDLTPMQASCREAACMTAIATAQNVEVVVAARVASDQQRLTSYLVHVRVVERMGGAAPPAVRDKKRSCNNCTEVTARDLLATALSDALVDEPEFKSPPKVAASESRLAPVAPKSEARPAPRLALATGAVPASRDRFSRPDRVALRVTGIVVGAAGVGLLAQGFVERGDNGAIVTEGDRRYQRDTTKKGQPLFFSLGAVSLLAGGVLELFGWLPRRVRVAPAVSSSGAHLQLGWAF